MAPTLVWWELTKTLIDAIRDAETVYDVTVEPGWPGDKNRTADMIWVFGVDGTETIPVMTAGRKQRDDRFDITIEVSVSSQPDLDSTMARTVELVAAVQDVLAEDPTLANFDGLVSAEITEKRMTVADMPMTEIGGLTGRAELVVSCHTRLT